MTKWMRDSGGAKAGGKMPRSAARLVRQYAAIVARQQGGQSIAARLDRKLRPRRD